MGKKRKKKERESFSPSSGETVSDEGLRAVKSKWKDLNFKVDPDFHYYVDNLASQHRLSKVELLRRAIAIYVEKHGAPVLREAQLE